MPLLLPRVLLDANVLIPLNPRDLFLAAAETAERTPLCRLFWTEEILAEAERNFPKAIRRGDATEKTARAAALVVALRHDFPDARITGYERFINRVTPADPDDRHVAAAAYCARLDALVTFNVRHYPPTTFDGFRFKPRVLDPDTFLMQLFHASPETLAARLRVQEGRGRRFDPVVTVAHILDRMAPRMPQFAAAMQAWMSDREGG